MKRWVLFGLLGGGVLGWLSPVTAAEAGGGKTQGAAVDPLAAAVESALALPAGARPTPQQQAAIEKVREHYRPQLRDAILKTKAEGRDFWSRRPAEEELAKLKAQALAEMKTALNPPSTSASTRTSRTEGDVNASIIGWGGVGVCPGSLGVKGHVYQPYRRYNVSGAWEADKPAGPAKPGGAAPTTTVERPSRPVTPVVPPADNTTTKKPDNR